MRKQKDDQEIYIHFDAAPIGFLSIAAHGHSDALSFLLHLNGKEVIVDPGTYTYHTDPVWRQYFIGSLAHNTLRINKKDQAVNGGPTLWLKHYKINLIESSMNEENDKIIASHDGYNGYGIFHKREVIFNKIENSIILNDSIEAINDKEFFVEFPMHFHPDMNPVKEDTGITVYDKNRTPMIKILTDANFEVNILKGNESPIIGWYSESFYQKEPCFALYQAAKAQKSICFCTRIYVY
jgi:uncharacterized heparinase superfamily protein